LTTIIKTATQRLVSIDALRAIVMILMIFVNDLWSLTGIPGWLEHAPGDANYMGLADVVFPAFLFIVGLSVPYAIESRRKKGDTNQQIFSHISSRTLALLVMGYFHVNLEIYDSTAIISRPVWQILITIAFFMIWLDYFTYKPSVSKTLKIIGVIILIVMAFLFKSEGQTGPMAMKVQWWGILGLIGWAYFISSCIYLFSGGKLFWQFAALVFFIAFNAATSLGWLHPLYPIRNYIWISGDGAMPTLPMAGIVTALFYRKYGSKQASFWISIGIFAAILMAFGFMTNPLWGISKIRATPSWTTVCAGITIITFGFMVLLTEILNQKKWYEVVKPAGTSTLTCYLLPYIHYALIGLLSIPHLTAVLRTGGPGLLKSFLYAMVIVTIAGLLGKRNIRLKI
jgi:predicted acyltransferase